MNTNVNLLNALHIVYLYHEYQIQWTTCPTPRTFIFAAKRFSSSGYQMAKILLNLSHSPSNDWKWRISAVSTLKQWVFIPDYKVTLAEIILPAADEWTKSLKQVRRRVVLVTWKLMLNGAVTLVQWRSNVEIYEAVGEDNIVIFGLEQKK